MQIHLEQVKTAGARPLTEHPHPENKPSASSGVGNLRDVEPFHPIHPHRNFAKSILVGSTPEMTRSEMR